MPAIARKFRPLALICGLALLAACGTTRDLEGPVEPLGDFYLGHNIVVAENAQRGPLSREADPEEWQESLTAEIDRRFRRFDGDRLYHLAINVEAYVLAVPGIPVVAAPKSALIFGVTVWDDAAGGKINEEPHRITVLENLSGETVISSGLTQTREQQMQNLSINAASAIERWLRRNSEWFGGNEPTLLSDDDAASDAEGMGPEIEVFDPAATAPQA
ncbi:hypothetical protein [Alkalilacustris brevis]|uniref:hypothetical protein n=1 Tax=Alkalilacustris brevis TaxID=2026338 RepID=UPI0012D319C5|nr:hypothetical protein [Alkalilacustris brevis]